MTAQGPVVAGSIQRLMNHKDYVVEMVNSIIKDADLDRCGEPSTKDLKASYLFNLPRVCSLWCSLFLILTVIFFFGRQR